MKIVCYILSGLLITLIISCGGDGNEGDSPPGEQKELATADPYENWKEYHGVGPIQPFELPAEIDQGLAEQGREIFESKCAACHKVDKKFIGPSPKDILTRRNPAWVMNMILVPEKMTQEDPIAKKLLIDFNGAPMANQNLTEEDARAVLEYFRTL